jgi:8-oxo-dGTP diphosphatase
VTDGPVVGVGGVILRAGTQVLLVRRRHPPAQGTWTLPGGKVCAGESLAEALRRGILEETSLHVTPGPLLEVVELMREGFHFVVLDYLCSPEPPDQEPIAASDADAVRWVDIAELSGAGASPELLRVVARAVAMPHETGPDSG